MSTKVGQRVRVTGDAEEPYVGLAGTVIGHSTEFLHVVIDGFDYLAAGWDVLDEPWHLFYREELESI
jgi:hypothetical protein